MTIYIDNDFKCYAKAADGLRAVETDEFEGKCPAFIEGHRYVPEGEQWVREDGLVFTGRMVCTLTDINLLEAAQAAYEDVLNSADAAYREGVDSI